MYPPQAQQCQHLVSRRQVLFWNLWNLRDMGLEEVELCAVNPEIYSLTLLPALSLDLQRSEQAASCSCCHSYVAMLLSQDTVKPHIKRHPSSFTLLFVRYLVIPMRK